MTHCADSMAVDFYRKKAAMMRFGNDMGNNFLLKAIGMGGRAYNLSTTILFTALQAPNMLKRL